MTFIQLFDKQISIMVTLKMLITLFLVYTWKEKNVAIPRMTRLTAHFDAYLILSNTTDMKNNKITFKGNIYLSESALRNDTIALQVSRHCRCGY